MHVIWVEGSCNLSKEKCLKGLLVENNLIWMHPANPSPIHHWRKDVIALSFFIFVNSSFLIFCVHICMYILYVSTSKYSRCQYNTTSVLYTQNHKILYSRTRYMECFTIRDRYSFYIKFISLWTDLLDVCVHTICSVQGIWEALLLKEHGFLFLMFLIWLSKNDSRFFDLFSWMKKWKW